MSREASQATVSAGSQTDRCASVIIVCTNDRQHLATCLDSVLRQEYRPLEVLLVDNGSTDGSVELVEATFPDVRVIRNGRNLGYTGANNRGFEASTGRYIVILNPDTEVAPGWLSGLIEGLDQHSQPAIATSKVLFFDQSQRGVVNTCGNDIHLTGLAFCRGLGLPADRFTRTESVPAVSGCCFASTRKVFERIGLFDEALFMTMEDTDLSLRARLADIDCLLVPASVLHHKYAIRLHVRKFFLLERNRWLILLKHLRWRTLLLLAPALLLTEALTVAYAILNGPAFVWQKIRAWWSLVVTMPRWLASRRRIQRLRRVPDSVLVGSMVSQVPFEQLTESPILRRTAVVLVDPLFTALHRAALSAVRW